MALITSTNMAPTNVFLQKDFLTRLNPLHCYAKLITKKVLQAKNSGTMEFPRIERIAPLTGGTSASVKSYVEGVTPGDTVPTLTKVQVSTALYANLMRPTEQVDLLNERAILSELVKLNAENLEDLSDIIIGSNLVSGTQVYRLTDNIGGTSGAARTDVDGIMNPVVLDKATNLFERNNCKPITKAVAASTNYGTAPIAAGWILITHPDVVRDMRNMPGWLRAEEYGGSKLDGEEGQYNKIRVVSTTNAIRFPDSGGTIAGTRSTSSSINDVYISLLISEDCAFAVDLAAALETVLLNANDKDKADPLGLSAAVGYKLRMGAGVMQDERILRIESAATA